MFFCFFLIFLVWKGDQKRTQLCNEGQQDIGLRESFPPFVVWVQQPAIQVYAGGMAYNSLWHVLSLLFPSSSIHFMDLFLFLFLFCLFLLLFSYKLAVRPSSIRRISSGASVVAIACLIETTENRWIYFCLFFIFFLIVLKLWTFAKRKEMKTMSVLFHLLFFSFFLLSPF